MCDRAGSRTPARLNPHVPRQPTPPPLATLLLNAGPGRLRRAAAPWRAPGPAACRRAGWRPAEGIDAFSGTIGTAMLDDNSNVNVEKWWQTVGATLWERGKRCLVVLDHVNRDKERRGRYPSGSKRKLEGAGVGLQAEALQVLTKQPPNRPSRRCTGPRRPGRSAGSC